MRAGTPPARWLGEALDDVHATWLRHRGCLRYALLTSRGARRHVRLRLPTQQLDEAAHLVGTLNALANEGIAGLPYPKQVDSAPPKPDVAESAFAYPASDETSVVGARQGENGNGHEHLNDERDES